MSTWPSTLSHQSFVSPVWSDTTNQCVGLTCQPKKNNWLCHWYEQIIIDIVSLSYAQLFHHCYVVLFETFKARWTANAVFAAFSSSAPQSRQTFLHLYICDYIDAYWELLFCTKWALFSYPILLKCGNAKWCSDATSLKATLEEKHGITITAHAGITRGTSTLSSVKDFRV